MSLVSVPCSAFRVPRWHLRPEHAQEPKRDGDHEHRLKVEVEGGVGKRDAAESAQEKRGTRNAERGTLDGRTLHVFVVGLAMLVVGVAPAGAQGTGAIVEDFSEERLGAAPTSFSTPTGFWSIGTNGVDSKPVLFEDGTQWQGSQTANTLASQAKALYGDRWNEFVDDLPGTAYFPIALFNKVPSFTGGTLTARLATVGGDIDQDAGVVFNYQPNGDMMAVRVDTLENNMKLYQWVQGQPSVLKLAENVPAAMARWHDVSVTVSNGGTHVSGTLDGFKFLDADLPTPVSGQVGAWAKTDTVVLFDSFVVDPQAQ